MIGASAGGFEVLKKLVAQLPADFPAAVLVVWHMPPDSPGLLASILAGAGPLPATQAHNGEPVQGGHIYVAPPDHHLMVEGNKLLVTHGPKENRFRPSVDVLFRSAAVACGERVVGVVLSGTLDDGASGLYAIKTRGGVAIVQDPVEAPYYDMPINAMRAVEVDYVLGVGQMGAVLTRLVSETVSFQGENPVPDNMETEVRIAREDHGLEIGVQKLGEPSMFTCPECHGTLLRIQEGKQVRFRCHTGHAFSLNSLLIETTKSIEDSLWSSLRAIEESEMLLSHISQHLVEHGENEAAAVFTQKLQEAKMRAELVRRAVLSNEVLSQDTLVPPPTEPDASA